MHGSSGAIADRADSAGRSCALANQWQRETAAESAGSKIIGSAPVLVEPFEVVAIAEGPEGFRRGPGPGTA